MAKHLPPDKKWRIEVDVNHLDALRRVARLTQEDMEDLKLCRAETYRKIMHTGITTLHIIARFATHFGISPGELIVWFPVPLTQPENVDLGKGRDRQRKKFWNRKGRKRHYKQWREDEVALLIKLRGERLSFKDCGLVLKRTAIACKMKYQEIPHEDKKTQLPGP